MNFLEWNDLKYQEFINYLYTLQDKKYQEFHSKNIESDNLIGIRTNELKKIAKEISQGDYENFIKYNTKNIYEPKMIEGFLYGYLKIPFQELIPYLDSYLDKIDNWALCDLFVSNLKIISSSQEEGFKFAKKLIRSKKNWFKRVGIVILLNYYLHDIYIDKTLELVSKIKSDDYYVKMAIAWLISNSYIKYKEKTLIYIISIQDSFTYHKTLSKIIDSRRISKEEKEFIKSLRKKNQS